MPISELLLPEFDEEMKKTRTTLERVPADKADFAPHPKSMPLGKLAPHIAQLAGFGFSILTTPELDFSKGSYKPVPLESAEQLVRVFDEGAAKVRGALQSAPDEAWKENWKLRLGSLTPSVPEILRYIPVLLRSVTVGYISRCGPCVMPTRS